MLHESRVDLFSIKRKLGLWSWISFELFNRNSFLSVHLWLCGKRNLLWILRAFNTNSRGSCLRLSLSRSQKRLRYQRDKWALSLWPLNLFCLFGLISSQNFDRPRCFDTFSALLRAFYGWVFRQLRMLSCFGRHLTLELEFGLFLGFDEIFSSLSHKNPLVLTHLLQTYSLLHKSFKFINWSLV